MACYVGGKRGWLSCSAACGARAECLDECSQPWLHATVTWGLFCQNTNVSPPLHFNKFQVKTRHHFRASLGMYFYSHSEKRNEWNNLPPSLPIMHLNIFQSLASHVAALPTLAALVPAAWVALKPWQVSHIQDCSIPTWFSCETWQRPLDLQTGGKALQKSHNESLSTCQRVRYPESPGQSCFWEGSVDEPRPP